MVAGVVVLGALGLLLLASPAKCQLGFTEKDYTLFENQDPTARPIEIVKETGENIGDITITLLYESLQQFRDNQRSEVGFDLTGLDTAETGASLPDDFLPTPTELTIPPSLGLNSVSFLTSIVSDPTHELAEAFFIFAQFTFDNAADQMLFENNLGQTTALIRIENDDDIEIGFERTMFELAEDSGATEVIFNKLNNVLTEVALTVMVNFANTGNGITPGDFTLDPTLPATFTLQPGERMQSLTLTIMDDNVLELDERFSLSLFKNASIEGVNVNSTLGVTDVTILDNEIITFGFEQTVLTVSEDVGMAEIPLRITDIPIIGPEFATMASNIGFLPNLFTVDNNVSAVAPDDYTSLNSMVTIQYDLARLFFATPSSAIVMVVNDTVPEETEEVTLSLTSGTAFGFRDIVSISPPSARLVIQDDDATPSVIGFVQSLYNTSEGDGFVEVCVSVLTPSDRTLLSLDYQANLTLSLESVTAQVGMDFESLTQDFTLTRDAPDQCFNVTINEDDILEVLEYFRATLMAVGPLPQEASLGTTEARINIFDNEMGSVGFEPENVTVTEGVDNFALVNVRFFNADVSSDVFTQLSVFTMDGTALVTLDYSEVSSTIMLQGGGAESMPIMVPIINDILVEDNETLTLVFTVLSDSGNIATYSPSMATITILDIDVPTDVVVGLERELYNTSEGQVSVEICAAILNPSTGLRLSAAELMTLDPAFSVSFNFSLTEISALAGADYTDLFMQFSLTPSNAFECFNVLINDDTIFELMEYFNASLDLNGLLPAGASLGITEARVRIDDNEEAVIGFREVLFSVNESVVFVKLYVEFLSPADISSEVEVNVTLFTVDDTAFGGSDFNQEEVTFTLKGGSVEVFDVDLTIIDDDVVERPESENLNVDINSSSPLVAELRITINPNRAVVTIIDNDEFVPSVVGFERSAYNVTEGDGSVQVCVAILQPADPTTLQATYSALLNLSTTDDTAIAGLDYGALSVVFSLTPTSPRQCFNISIEDDSILETSEDFLGNLLLLDPLPPATSLGTSETRVTIFDNEEAVVGFGSDNVVVFESDGPAVLTISILTPSTVSPSVAIALSLATADNTAVAGMDYETLTMDVNLSGGAGATSQAQVVIINDDQQEIPTRENLTATLTLTSANVPVTLTPATSYVTIIDDDNVTVIGFLQTTYTTREGNGLLEICAAVLEPADPNLLDPSFTASVRFILNDGTAIAPGDYIDVDQLLQFTASGPVQCVNVTIVDDEDGETTEDFRARLLPDGPLPAGVTLTPDEAAVSIFDNEVLSVIGFEMPSYTVGEGDGVAEICVAILSPADPSTLPSSYSANIEISTIPGNAQAPGDFVSQSGAFTLTPTQPRACIDVTIEDDRILEVDESFNGTLVGVIPPTATFSLTSTTVIIRDNEMGVIGILNEMLQVREDVGNVTVYMGFTKPDAISSDIVANITFFTQDSSAVAGLDYVGVRESFILDQGMLVRGVPVTIIFDDETERSEAFETNIEAGSPLPARVTLNPSEGNISIDDVPFIPTLSSVPPPTSQEPTPTNVRDTPTPTISPAPTSTPEVGMGGDPHYSIMLPTGQLLCFSVHGEKNFPFNLISNSLLQMNAFFIEDARREEITWIGSLGVVVQHSSYKKSNTTKIRFEAKDQMIYINNGVSLLGKRVEKLTLANGKLTITEGLRRRGDRKPEVEVDLVDIGLHFTVRFVKKRHLDMTWKRVELQPSDSHGFIGQFLRKGVEIDETRKLLHLPTMDPVPVMRSSVWHFMERESPDQDQPFCWQAMNPGYQGKMLIEGSYLDYLVDDVLSSDFEFNPKMEEL